MVIFLFVALITYWVYLRQTPIQIIRNLVEDATSDIQTASFTLPSTSRYTFLLYSQIFTTLCFGGLAIYGFTTRHKTVYKLGLLSGVD